MEGLKRALSDLKVKDPIADDKEGLVKNLLDSGAGFVYLWDAKNCQVVACKQDGGGGSKVVLTPTDTPLFNVTHLKVCPLGKSILLAGPCGLTVLRLPAVKQLVDETGSEIICRVLTVGDRFYSTHSKTRIQQVEWHPQTSSSSSKDDDVTGSHLVVLSTDNNLRIFDFESKHGGQFPVQTVHLGGGSRGNNSTTFGTSMMSVKAALGDTAVAFAFGPSIEGDEEGQTLWPLFLLHGDGGVYSLLTGLGDSAVYQPTIAGPLAMLPPDAECDRVMDSCAILCLQAAPSCPPILIVAATNGTLHHFVVLHKAKDEGQDQGQGRGGSRLEPAPMTLYAYESVQLELGLDMVGADQTTVSSPPTFNCPIQLSPDPLSSGLRYLCLHRAGVHCVALPMAAQLAEMAMSDDDAHAQITAQAQEDSIVEYLVCTRVKGGGGGGVIGVNVTVNKLSGNLVCLFNDYDVKVLPLTSESHFPRPLMVAAAESEKAAASVTLNATQPLLQRREAFDQRIAKVLQRPISHPLIHSDSTMKMSGEELLSFLTKSTQTLRSEYMTKLEKARVEIQRKVEILESKKRQQQSSLLKLREEKRHLTAKAGKLSEEYQDLQDHNERLSSRLEAALSKIQDRQTVRSDAELKMQRKLVEIGRRMNDLDNGMTQIRAKEKYQLRQIHCENEARSLDNKVGQKLVLGHKQLQSVKAVLESTSADISDLVKQVNNAKKELCAS